MKIEKSEYNYQVTECDLKYGKQITLDRELLIPISVLDKIRAEIDTLRYFRSEYLGVEEYSDYFDGHLIFKESVFDIIDKYKAESEDKG